MASTEIKLTPAMETALKGARIKWSPGFGRYAGVVPEDTKGQTVKGLNTRGLSDSSGFLSDDGVEAARQLGAEFPPKGEVSDLAALEALLEPVGFEVTPEPNPRAITPEMIEKAAEDVLSRAVDLNKAHVVPNREDKRKSRFSLKGAYSRMVSRKRQRKVKKYGSTNYTGEVS